jgi:hypothetical protein
MPDTIKRSRTETFEHTISGLLTKRADLFNEAATLRDRIAEIRNDIDSLDRVLGTLGYKGDLDASMPRQKREVIFGRGELSRGIMEELRITDGQLTSREVAQSLITTNGHDKRDRKYVADLTRRVSKALRLLASEGRVRKTVDVKGNVMWGRR